MPRRGNLCDGLKHLPYVCHPHDPLDIYRAHLLGLAILAVDEADIGNVGRVAAESHNDSPVPGSPRNTRLGAVVALAAVAELPYFF